MTSADGEAKCTCTHRETADSIVRDPDPACPVHRGEITYPSGSLGAFIEESLQPDPVDWGHDEKTQALAGLRLGQVIDASLETGVPVAEIYRRIAAQGEETEDRGSAEVLDLSTASSPQPVEPTRCHACGWDGPSLREEVKQLEELRTKYLRVTRAAYNVVALADSKVTLGPDSYLINKLRDALKGIDRG